MGDGWSECGFDSVSNPGHQQWLDDPLVFPILWFFTGLFNRPVDEPEFFSGSQGRSERTCPLFIVVPLQLDLSNRKPRIIKRYNIVWGKIIFRFSPDRLLLPDMDSVLSTETLLFRDMDFAMYSAWLYVLFWLFYSSDTMIKQWNNKTVEKECCSQKNLGVCVCCIKVL